VTEATEERLGAEVCGVGSQPFPVDEQDGLLADLDDLASEDVSVQDLLDLVFGRLAGCLGLTGAAVFRFDRGSHDPRPVAEVGDTLALLSGPGRPGPETVPLRTRGQDVGFLRVAGCRLGLLRPGSRRQLAQYLAVTLRAYRDEEEHAFLAHSSRAVRRLFEEGSNSATVPIAGEVLARVTAQVFRTELAAVHLVDVDGRICQTIGVGVSPALSRDLESSLIGRFAADSPVWRRALQIGGPVLVEDADATPVRGGGFVQTMKVRCYIAMPLMSAAGPVGMAMCGDTGRTRVWTEREKELARELALAGALIIDSARLRQSDRAHVTELTYQAFHDPLTGLGNRALFLDRTASAVATAIATGGHPAVLFVDLDGFKAVNDSLGHEAGDLLLQEVSRRLAKAVGDHDAPARLGGDEFAVLLSADTGQHAAAEVAQRIHRSLSRPFHLNGIDQQIGASIGIALFPEHARDVTGLLRCADTAMYRAKKTAAGPKTVLGSQTGPTPSTVLDARSRRAGGRGDRPLQRHQDELPTPPNPTQPQTVRTTTSAHDRRRERAR
jgi:diguanylate cyclase (GGDEF)-like protein